MLLPEDSESEGFTLLVKKQDLSKEQWQNKKDINFSWCDSISFNAMSRHHVEPSP